MTKNKPSLKNNCPRNIAVNSLLAFVSKGVFIQEELHRIFDGGDLDQRDHRLATELAMGACRQMITLDHVIHRYSTRPLRQIDPVIRQILRIALYQMIFMNTIPDFAIVTEAVTQSKQLLKRGADGFVNAVLRAIQSDIAGPITLQDALPTNRSILRLNGDHGIEFKSNILPDLKKNPAKHFSIAYALPPWLIERWLNIYGPDTLRRIGEACNARPRLTLRTNSLCCDIDTLADMLDNAGVRHIRTNQAIQILQPAVPENLPGYADGLFTVQDLTAMLPATMLDPKPGDAILDLCAAPGGKTTQIAELMQNTGKIIACDIQREKLTIITENCRRLGIDMVTTCPADQLDETIRQVDTFDAVLVDVPCSNTGVFAKRPEARHRLKPAAISQLTKIQLDLLNRAARSVKPTGKLLYSTCSIDPAENQDLVKKFLTDHPDFHLIREILTLPQTAADQDDSSLSHDGGYIALLTKSTSE